MPSVTRSMRLNPELGCSVSNQATLECEVLNRGRNSRLSRTSSRGKELNRGGAETTRRQSSRKMENENNESLNFRVELNLSGAVCQLRAGVLSSMQLIKFRVYVRRVSYLSKTCTCAATRYVRSTRTCSEQPPLVIRSRDDCSPCSRESRSHPRRAVRPIACFLDETRSFRMYE